MNLKYISILTFFNNTQFDDINYIAILRCPVYKQASYCLITLNIKQAVLQKLNYELAQGCFPNIRVEIISKESEGNKKLNPIFDRKLKCLYARTSSTVSMQDDMINCTLLLVNPILYELEIHNGYNKILENTTGYDVLLDYEQYLKSTYGNQFDFKKINDTKYKNEYKYEQILVHSKNDINVPTYLINTYKTHNVYTYYFFDDFDLSAKNEISAIYFNINEKQNLTQFDVTKYADTRLFTYVSDKIPFSDTFSTSNFMGSSVIFNTNQMANISSKKENLSGLIVKKDQEPEEDEEDLWEIETFTSRRNAVEAKKYKDVSYKEMDNTKSQKNIYVPDDSTNGQLRLDLFKKFMNEGILEIINYNISNVLPDFPNFGKLYNLEQDMRGEYIFTPFTICNLFTRDNIKETNLSHNVRSLMFKYKYF